MKTVINNPLVQVYEGDALATLRTLEADSVDCCVTSPPYWGLRDYGHAEQMGLEASPFEYIEKMAGVFDEVRRVLKPNGTCWIVIGDSYAGSWGAQSRRNGGPSAKQDRNKGTRFHASISAQQIAAHPKRTHTGSVKHFNGIKAKDLCGIPWRLAFALQDRGWYLRQDIIWAKPNPMPESVTDRCTRSHEYVFLLTKRARYFYDAKAISSPALNAGLIYRNGNQSLSRGQALGIGCKPSGNATKDYWTIANDRNERSVWSLTSEPYALAHFATFPTKLVERCILAGSPADGHILDPFAGCGTTGEVAVKLGRRAVLIELNSEYVEMIRKNLGLFAVAASA